MDKIETALTATEDNAAAIRALNKKIDRLADGLTNKVIYGVANDAGATFGELESDGTRCALIIFGETVKRKAIFCKVSCAYSYSPMFVKIPAGRGEFMTTAPPPVRALLLAPNTVMA